MMGNLIRVSTVALFSLLALMVLAPTQARAQGAGPISRYVIGSGATDGSNGTVQVKGTVGQTAVGVSQVVIDGKINDVNHGFWWFPKTTSTGPTGPVVGETRALWNSPNPFATSTTVSYRIPARSQVRVKIYDMSGRLVKTLVDDVVSEGTYSATWDATDEFGQEVATGYYMYALDAQPMESGRAAISERQQMIYIK